MSYQLGYEQGKFRSPFNAGFKCILYQLGYKLLKTLKKVIVCFKCISYQLEYFKYVKSCSKDSFFILQY